MSERKILSRQTFAHGKFSWIFVSILDDDVSLRQQFHTADLPRRRWNCRLLHDDTADVGLILFSADIPVGYC